MAAIHPLFTDVEIQSFSALESILTNCMPTEEQATVASSMKLDLRRFNADRSHAKVLERVDTDIEMATKLGVGGTPTLYVNGTKLQNVTAFDSVSASIDNALSMTK